MIFIFQQDLGIIYEYSDESKYNSIMNRMWGFLCINFKAEWELAGIFSR